MVTSAFAAAGHNTLTGEWAKGQLYLVANRSPVAHFVPHSPVSQQKETRSSKLRLCFHLAPDFVLRWEKTNDFTMNTMQYLIRWTFLSWCNIWFDELHSISYSTHARSSSCESASYLIRNYWVVSTYSLSVWGLSKMGEASIDSEKHDASHGAVCYVRIAHCWTRSWICQKRRWSGIILLPEMQSAVGLADRWKSNKSS